MNIVRNLLLMLSSALNNSDVRIGRSLCTAAGVKALTYLIISEMPLDDLAQSVFTQLQNVALIGTAVDVVKTILEKKFGLPISEWLNGLRPKPSAGKEVGDGADHADGAPAG